MRRASAADWYSTQRIGDDITHVSEPHILEFYRCNIWYVRGRDRDMLVDTGMGVVSLREQVPLVTEKSCLAVASHTHFDHVGNHHEFDERLVHRLEAEILASPTRANTVAEAYVSDEIFTPPVSYSSTEYSMKGGRAARLLDDGDIIDLGDRQFVVVHAPVIRPVGSRCSKKRPGCYSRAISSTTALWSRGCVTSTPSTTSPARSACSNFRFVSFMAVTIRAMGRSATAPSLRRGSGRRASDHLSVTG
jgi:hypothetical protein